MNPENICCSLETAQEIKEAGWVKETAFVWLGQCNENYRLWPINHIGYVLDDMDDFYYAPTTSEICIPDDCTIKQFSGRFTFYKGGEHATCIYYPTEAEAKAGMWMYLKREELK